MSTDPTSVEADPPAGSESGRAVDAMLAEYETLRQESLQSIGHRMTVVTFTFAILGVIISGLLTGKVADLLAGLIAICFVPQVAKAALWMWLGEYQRSRRAGKAVAELERKINTTIGVKALSWESNLWKPTIDPAGASARHMDYPYVAVIVFLLGAAYTAIALGIYLLYGPAEKKWDADAAFDLAVGISLLAALFEGAFLWDFQRRWSDCRKRTN